MSLKDLIQKKENCEQEIYEIIKEEIAKDSYFLKQVKKLENGEYDYLSSNELQGVDYRVEFKIQELQEIKDAPKDLVVDALEALLDEYCFHYNKREEEISSSSGEEIFISTHDKMIFFPDKTKPIKMKDDFHAWLVIEEWMEDKGCYPGVFSQDYYGNTDEWKFDEKYGDNFPDDSKTKISMLRDYISIYEMQSALDEGYRYQLSDLPEKCYELLSPKLKELHSEQVVAILEVHSVEVGSAVIEVEYEIEDQMALEKITINFSPNSLRYIFEEGVKNEMSFMSIG
jgi:hypothetical protein